MFWKLSLTPTNTTTTRQYRSGGKDNEGVTIHSQDLQNWSLTTKYHTKNDLPLRKEYSWRIRSSPNQTFWQKGTIKVFM